MNITVKLRYDTNGRKVLLDIQELGLARINLDFEHLSILGHVSNGVINDLLLLGSVVYALDRRIKRKDTIDAWTRVFNIQLPVSDPKVWDDSRELVQNCLNFLSGDKWLFSFTKLDDFGLNFETTSEVEDYDAVSLFSGGLDSLVGVINLLEAAPEKKLILVGHHDPHMPGPKSDQERLLTVIERQYPNRILPFFIGIGTEQAIETTLRSRSFLFISMGVFASCFLSGKKELLIPENGTIALNVPLTPSRQGTCSTRTAHPHYLQLYQELLIKLGIPTILSNPLEKLTKGEVVEACLNKELLKATVDMSVSCGKRGHHSHWVRRNASECGRCMPCIYRRAALHKIGLDNEIYGNDICSGEVDPYKNKAGSNDLRAVLSFIKNDFTPNQIAVKLACNGRLEQALLNDYAEMIARTRGEIKQLLRDKANNEIKTFAGLNY